MTTATWTKPGPGTWLLDSSHCGPAPCAIQRGIFSACLPRGVEDGMTLFGSPLKTMDLRWVNGRFYRRLVPLVGGDRDLPAPPPIVLKLATRLHPAFRAAERRSRETFAIKRWRDEVRRWEDEWKPSITKRNLELTDIDVASLTDAELADHLRAVHHHLLETTTLHFRLHVSDMGPLGNLMISLESWGLTRDDAFRALVAASPATREPARLLRQVAAALRDAGIEPGAITSLEEVRAVPAANDRLEEYLRFHGWRLTTGYEVEDRCLIELPDVIVTSIRGASSRAAVELDPDGAIAELRSRVPAEHHAELDELIEDARSSYGLRDENGPLTYEWPGGLLRRALLECERRLGTHTFEMTVDELVDRLDGGTGPSASELAARAEERRWWATLDAPAQLGPDEPDPPVPVMPPNLGRMTRIVLTVVETLEAKAAGRQSLRGTGIGAAAYTGTARVVHDAVEALAVMEPGDVVVAPYTAPTYNAVLSMAGAIVTEEGGLLCHAAVIARELGIPAVIGAADAMASIPDGATVEVDPVAGTVRVL